MSVQIDMTDLNRQLARFDRSVRRFLKEFEGSTEQAVRKIAVDLYRDVVSGTPRDTGRAKLGWALDVAVSNYIPPANQKSYPAPTTPSPPPTLALYLFNNIEYIIPLEMGSSRQAPAGMVRPALIKHHDRLKQEILSRAGKYWR